MPINAGEFIIEDRISKLANVQPLKEESVVVHERVMVGNVMTQANSTEYHFLIPNDPTLKVAKSAYTNTMILKNDS